MFAERGLDVLQLGDEAILDIADFSLSGRTMKPVRNVVNHAKRHGLVVDCIRAKDLSAVEATEVRRRADAWRDGPVERGFSMALGRFGDPADGECVLVRARVEGELVGLLHMVPWGRDGLSLDLMRRKPDSPNGVVESMVNGVAEWGRANRIANISLNFAVMRDVFERGEQLGAPLGTRMSYSVLTFVSRFFQLDSLYRSNRKYQPRWMPRYICHGPGTLFDVGIAMLRAEAFLTMPSFGRRGASSVDSDSDDDDGEDPAVTSGEDPVVTSGDDRPGEAAGAAQEPAPSPEEDTSR